MREFDLVRITGKLFFEEAFCFILRYGSVLFRAQNYTAKMSGIFIGFLGIVVPSASV